MTTEKTIALTRWTFVGKVMSPLSNMLPKLVFPVVMGTKIFQMFKLDLEKTEEAEIKLPTSIGS